MNKKQIISISARKVVYSKWEIALMMDPIFSSILEALGQGEDVHIQGFGRFEVKDIKARHAINPNTKEHIVVPAKKKIIFHPTPHFKFVSESDNKDDPNITANSE